MNKYTEKITARFWGKVDKSSDGCWLWTAAKDRKGYGKFSVGAWADARGHRLNTMRAAHRVSWEMANGDIPESFEGSPAFILHKCDTPACVNPSHLMLGNNLKNVQDMDSKGRRVTKAFRGSDHANAKLDEARVREIVRLYKSLELSGPQIAERIGVSYNTVNFIITGRLWAHLNVAVPQSERRKIAKHWSAVRARERWGKSS